MSVFSNILLVAWRVNCGCSRSAVVTCLKPFCRCLQNEVHVPMPPLIFIDEVATGVSTVSLRNNQGLWDLALIAGQAFSFSCYLYLDWGKR